MADAPKDPLSKSIKSLKELEECKQKIDGVLAYCRDKYASDKKKIFTYTQSETKNALQNVTYHINAMSQHLSSVLSVQASEIEKIDLQLKEITNRVQLSHQEVGNKALVLLRTEHEGAPLQPDKIKKLEGTAIPSLPAHQRQKIEFGELDNIGISLASGQATKTFGTIRNTQYSQRSVSSAPANTGSFASGPPTLARNFDDMVPPPSDLPPPPMGAPPPPPPDDLNGLPPAPNELPPPPPADLPIDLPTDLPPAPDELPPPPPMDN